MPTPRFHPQYTALLIIDMQEKLIPIIHEKEALITQTQKLIQGFNTLNIPILLTQQYPQGLGQTISQITDLLPQDTYSQDKTTFSAITPEIYQHLSSLGIRNLVIAGVETHICAMQSCLDAIDKGFITGIVHNATSSRNPIDKNTALQRLTQTNVIPLTTESILFELQQTADSKTFKPLAKIIK